jgi:GDP-D-mannose 3',5'-epimerase
MKVLVTGAGGAIGGALTERLLKAGHSVRAVDLKPLTEWWRAPKDAELLDRFDLRCERSCRIACENIDQVYLLAADMGGMGFIETNKAACMLTIQLSTNVLVAARDCGVERLFYSSSACVYPASRQTSTAPAPLEESMAYPADSEDGYGWEKLFSERMCRHFTEDYGLQTRVARYHNVYGPFSTWDGGREKAPAAICRKVALAVITSKHEIEIWGDGQQGRSFMYIDDCLEGSLGLMASDHREPLNIGSSELVSVNQLVSIVEQIAGVELHRTYDLSKPQGVRGRTSDNRLCRSMLGWEPTVSLIQGLEPTYRWVYDQVKKTL